MKSYLGKIIHLLIFVLLAACLPQEKTTQCTEGQAYNATERRCVTTQANSSESISINSVSPTSSYALSLNSPAVTHSIIVNDPFSLGYSIKWNVKQPNGSTFTVGTGLSYTFIQAGRPAGSYILEAQVLDASGGKVLDTRSWTINLTTDAIPTISSTSPATQSTTTSTTTAIPLLARLDNPDGISDVKYQWYVNGNAVAGATALFSATSQDITFNFNARATEADNITANPYHVGAGTYTIQLALSKTISGTEVQYDNYTWTIQNNLPMFPTVTRGVGTSAGATFGNETPPPGQIITVIDELDIPGGGFLSANAGALEAKDICLYVSDHTGVSNSNVYVDFLIDGAGVPNATGLQFTASGAAGTLCMGTAAGSTYSINIPSTIQVESRTITAVVYDGFTGATGQPTYNGGAEILRYNWTARVRQKNAAPTITILNTASHVTCASNDPTSAAGCSATQDAISRFAIEVSDDADGDGFEDFEPYNTTTKPTDYQNFQVDYYLNGQILDGTHPLSNTDCSYGLGEAAPNNTDPDGAGNLGPPRYECPLVINSYDANGPVNPGAITYTIVAKVRDNPLAAYGGGVSAYSNETTWVIPAGNLAYADPDTVTATPFGPTQGTDSVVTNSTGTVVNDPDGDGGGAPATAVTENDVVNFLIRVDDPQRDSHTIEILRCDSATDHVTAVACVSEVPVATKIVVSSNADQVKQTVVAHQIKQDALKAAANGIVYYKIIVTGDSNENPESVIATSLNVNNYNPEPELSGTQSPAYNSATTRMMAFAGFPISINPGDVTDASIIDGEEVRYQWIYSTGGAYNVIPGATSKNLVWAPGSMIDFDTNPNGAEVQVKLCLGDNGYYGADPFDPFDTVTNDCRVAAPSQSSEWYFMVYSNVYQGNSLDTEVADGPVAVWIDPSTKDPIVKYMAYVNINKEIVVEKFVTKISNTNDTDDFIKQGSTADASGEEIAHVVFRATTDPLFGTNDVTNLSITGDTTNKALYIAYMAPVSGVDQVHVRRIDIREGKTGFTHQGVFGFDQLYGADTLLDNVVPGPGLSTSIDGQGRININVTDPADQAGINMTLRFTGLSSHGTVETFTEGTNVNEFCGGGTCGSTTATASALAASINASTFASAQGVIANASGSSVIIEGVYEGDYLELDNGATDIGDIMVNKTTGRWEIPMIDSNFTGSNKFKLSMYYGDLNTRLTSSSHAKIAIDGLSANILPADEIANDIFESNPDNNAATPGGNDRIIIATRNRAVPASPAATDGAITIYQVNANATYTLAGAAGVGWNTGLTQPYDLFSDTNVTDIKLKLAQKNSTTDSNKAGYLMGRNASGEFAYARFERDTAGVFNLSFGTVGGVAGMTIALDLDSAFDLFENNNATQYDISPGGQQYQLFMAATDSINNTAYIATIKNSNPSVDCSYQNDQDLNFCMKLTANSTADTVENLPIALSDIHEDVTLADAGLDANENINDIMMAAFHVQNGGSADPFMALINTTPINVTGDNTTIGQYHNIPYVND